MNVTEISFYLNGLSVRDSSIDGYLRHSLLSAGGVWYGGGWGGAGDGDTGTGGHAALLLLHKEPPPACVRSTATVDPSLSPPAEKDRTATMLKAILAKHPYCTQISLFMDVVQLWTLINMPMTYSYIQCLGLTSVYNNRQGRSRHFKSVWTQLSVGMTIKSKTNMIDS